MTSIRTRAGQAHIQLYADTPRDPVRWRLLGGNNRELGRGSTEYPDTESARRAIRRLQQTVAELEQRLVRGEASSWSWVLLLDGVPVATSGHRYDRLIRCRQGVAYFMAQLATSEIGASPAFTQSRRWHTAASRRNDRP